MIEIEVKLKINDCDVLEKHLLGQGYKLTETLRETDTYFDGGINGIKKSGQALRVRRTVNCVTGKEQSAITFKGKKIDTVSMARLELETGVESGEAAERILCALGFYPVQPIVVKTRKILKNGNICACLDDVQGLGTFLELEIMAESEAARPAALDRIEGILKNIGYTMADTTRASYLSQLQKMGENMRTNEYYIKLGKKLCKMLRHKPEQYGLVLDEYGWGNVSEILKALHKYATWQDVTEEDIAETVRTDNKGRFELSRGNIRALYGHSFHVKILKPVAAPPEILYHGTSHKAA